MRSITRKAYKPLLAVLLLVPLMFFLFSLREEHEMRVPSSPSPRMSTLQYYASHSTTTDPGNYAHLYEELPKAIPELAKTAQGLLIHVFHTQRYGVDLRDERKKEVRIRKVEGILERIIELDERPLTETRDPQKRVVSDCRDFAVLMCSFLRHQGIPARVRNGFVMYFIPESYQHHWVCEYWSKTENRWVRVDAQLDSIQTMYYSIDFDPLDVPAAEFLYAGTFHQMLEHGKIDVDQSGMGKSESLGFAREVLVRDFLALNKRELDSWDRTKLLDQGEYPVSERSKIIERIIELTTSRSDRLPELQRIYRKHARLWMPLEADRNDADPDKASNKSLDGTRKSAPCHYWLARAGWHWRLASAGVVW